jgi:hypothetical protein
MLSQKALHIIFNLTELSNGISSCQGIFSVHRGRNIRQCICVPLGQVASCGCCPSFREEITKLVHVFTPKNTLEEEIRERIAKGNKAFYANKTLLKSNLVSRKFKLKLYFNFT